MGSRRLNIRIQDKSKISKNVTASTFIVGGCLALATYSFAETKAIAITRYSIRINNLPPFFKGFTILHLSDLHSKWFGAGQDRLLEEIKKHRYDMVAITGDLIDKDNPDPEPGLQLVKNLTDKPIYFVPGNHEWWSGYHIRESLLKHGVKVLENRAEKFELGQQYIWVLGVDDPYLGRDDIQQAMTDVEERPPKILLAHAPGIYERAINSKIDLVLVGHTHGGQIRIPLIGALVAPGQGLFPEFVYGLYTTGSTKMIISNGLGESVLPIRFNASPEIALITLELGKIT